MKIFYQVCGIAIAVLLVGCDWQCAPVANNPVNQTEPKDISNTKEVFMTDFEAAKSQAKIGNKPIMVVFSGSDWCGWCKKLDKEVFSTTEFKNWAKDNAIMFIADFPRNIKLSPEAAKQNELLAKTYGVEGFPTVVIIDAEGKELARTGYRAGGPSPYIEHLKPMIKK